MKEKKKISNIANQLQKKKTQILSNGRGGEGIWISSNDCAHSQKKKKVDFVKYLRGKIYEFSQRGKQKNLKFGQSV